MTITCELCYQCFVKNKFFEVNGKKISVLIDKVFFLYLRRRYKGIYFAYIQVTGQFSPNLKHKYKLRKS